MHAHRWPPRGLSLVVLHKSESPTILGVSVEAPTCNLVSAGFASLAGLPILRTCKTSHRVKPGNIRTCVVQRGTSPVAAVHSGKSRAGSQSSIHGDRPRRATIAV